MYYCAIFYLAGDTFYSARLYRSVEREGVVSAVFCMSLNSELYIKVVPSLLSSPQ